MFENDDIVVYRNPVTEEVQIIAVKRITDNTFPNHIIIDGTDYPIHTILPVMQRIEWPEWQVMRPDTLIIPEGIRIIGHNFTVNSHKTSRTKYPNLRYLKLPNTLESIGSDAFYNNYINDIIIPPSVIEIEKKAFKQCHMENLDLGKVQFIGANAFMDCKNLKWVRIPKETRIIGKKAFKVELSDKYRLSFLQLSSLDINPIIDFADTFGPLDIPYLACSSEFLRPEITAKYQSDMPEVFDNRAMIHLESSPVPLYFSFEETGEKEGLWEPGIDLWALTGKNRKKESENSRSGSETKNSQPVYKYETDRFLINNPRAENERKDRETEAPLPESEPEPADGTLHISYPVKFRMDTSSLPENKKKSLRVTYNDIDITDSLVDDSFTIWYGKPFDNEGYISGAEPIYNRIKIILEE
ncbi:MAG: leucine-rich repeat domain-containing protein [Bacteroidales bacterium]|nr:leucine-rich repeat domain-containing protein [Bacteroidales bacterium]